MVAQQHRPTVGTALQHRQEAMVATAPQHAATTRWEVLGTRNGSSSNGNSSSSISYRTVAVEAVFRMGPCRSSNNINRAVTEAAGKGDAAVAAVAVAAAFRQRQHP